MDHVATAAQTIGPFFHFALTPNAAAGRLAGPDAQGECILVKCRVLDGDGVPVSDAMIELWQADTGGFGRLATDEEGACVFETIRPGRIGTGHAPHINVSIFARGLLNRLVTRIYFAGDPANDADSVLELVPEDRRGTLLARPDASRAGVWDFEIRLASESETVFFDV